MTTFPSSTLNFTNQGTTYSTFLTGIRGDNIVGMYVDANNLDQGLLYDLQLGTWIGINYPGAASHRAVRPVVRLLRDRHGHRRQL